MKVPCCSVCQTRYNDEDRAPLLLNCGHGFCKDCLSRMFSSSLDNSLSCPRCRHVTLVGNSVAALRKNYALLPLTATADVAASASSSAAGTDSDSDSDDRRWSFRGCGASSGIEMIAHGDLKLVQRIGETRRPGVEVWAATVVGKARRCRHKVAVKKVVVEEDMDVVWVQSQLESLRQGAMWCRNVCSFHGMTRLDDTTTTTSTSNSLCLVMDRCYGSLQSEMQRNEGRFTLEQILRYGADIARGVAELHAAGVVCMNLKPSNLLLDASGRAVVSDYGLPAILKKPSCRKARAEGDSSKIHSCMDCTMLSPHYTAPEAWEPVRKSLNLFWEEAIGISAESDAWSFGCTLVEMCTGSIPWAGLSAEEIYRTVVKARKLPPQYASVVGVGIPRDLWKMIGECLQFKPSKRPTFSAMLAIFLRHLQSLPRSPPLSPENDVAAHPATNLIEPSLTSVLEVYPYNPNLLHRLVSEGDLNGVRSFLARAASGAGSSAVSSLLEAQNNDGQTALHLACRRGSAELVEAILEYKEAEVDILDKDGDPPLVFALAAGSPECVRALIKRHANVSSRLREGLGPSVAHVCAYHGQPDCMRELLLAGTDPNGVDEEGESVLHRAVAKKYTDCALVILEHGGSRSMAMRNLKNLTPLHMCVASWNVAVVRRWVEVASFEEIAEAINILSPVGTALSMAAAVKKDHEKEGRELVRLLLAAGADPTAQDAQQRTALHTAAMANDIELIILDAGVDVNIRNVHNTIPLHVALARGAKSCIGLLLSAGADYNFQDDEGDNAFHIAADAAKMIRENFEWIIHMLNYHDASVDLRNHSGKTLKDFLEALPREWISEDLMQALLNKGVQLSPTMYEVGDWVKFRRSVTTPTYGWQGARHRSVGFIQSIPDKDHLIISFCTGEARVLVSEVIKVIPLDRGQHVKLKDDVKEPRFGWRGQSRESIGTVLCVDDDGILRVGFPGASRGWKGDPAEMERVEEYKVGDWVRIRPTLTAAKHGLGSVTPGSVVGEPRYAWGGETHHSVGKISEIESDGLLIIEIPNRPIPWQADPADMEKVEDFKVGDWVRVKSTVSSPKYGWEDVNKNSVGVIHSLEDDGDIGVAFCFRSKLFSCSVTDVEKVTPFEVGQEIHVSQSIIQPRLGWSDESPATVGKIVKIDMDGALNVKVVGRSKLWRVSPGDAECLSGFEVGDWVRSKPSLGTRPSYDWNSTGKEGIAVVHSVQENGCLDLACCFRKIKSHAHCTDVEKVPRLKVGQHVKFRAGIAEPRWGWRHAKPDSRGIIVSVHADGEVRVAFFGLPGLWRADPSDLEIEPVFYVGEWAQLKNATGSWKSVVPGNIGVVQGLEYEGDHWNGRVSVGFCGEHEKWVGPSCYLERANKLILGQKVRVKFSVKQPRFGWSGHSHTSIGIITAIDADGKLRIYTPAGSKAWMLDPSEVEPVEEAELQIGDWVKVKDSVTNPTHQWGEVTPSSIGVVHRREEGELWVAFCFIERLWLCKISEMEKVMAFKIGDKVKMKDGLVAPRWGWGMETHASRGQVVGVDANGKLRIRFRWREGKPWIGDPADIALDEP
ncbi:hypothetical protein KSS87_008312 [Heliosperma pusillum]|nr:hypothetical protein KSS87_008312 [Heliosperma pusillum]